MAAEGFFRSKTGFTVVQNFIIRDKNLSLKAKGLYLMIQAYITMPDKKWRKDDFFNMCREGEKAFESAWKELKYNGYLRVHCMPKNGIWHVEYELLDEPAEGGEHTFYYDGEGNLSSSNLDRENKKQEGDKALTEDAKKEPSEKCLRNEDSDRYPPFGSNGEKEGSGRNPHFGGNGDASQEGLDRNPLFGSNGNGTDADRGNKNIKTCHTNPLHKTCNPYPYLYPDSSGGAEVIHPYTMEFLTRHYQTDELVQMGMEREDVDMVLEILYDALNTEKPHLWVNREKKPIEVIRSRLLKLDVWELQYAVEQYKKQTTEIRHQKAYMLSLLFTAKGQCNLDLSNQVMRGIYGRDRDGDGNDG